MSVRIPSAAVLFSAFSTSSSTSTRADPKTKRSRQTEIEQRLRRQPARAALLEQDTLLVVLADRHLTGGRPGLAAEVPEIGGGRQARLRHVDRAHHPEHVRPIVGEQPARVGEIVRIASERERLGRRRRDRADLGARRGGATGRLQPRRPRERVRPERLPAVGSSLVNRDHQAVVSQRVTARRWSGDSVGRPARSPGRRPARRCRWPGSASIRRIRPRRPSSQ